MGATRDSLGATMSSTGGSKSAVVYVRNAPAELNRGTKATEDLKKSEVFAWLIFHDICLELMGCQRR